MAEEPNSTLDSILRRRRRRRTLMRALGATGALALGGVFLWLHDRDELAEPMPSPGSPTAEVETLPAPPAAAPDLAPVQGSGPESAVSEPLPPLAESDPFVRRIAAGLSSRTELLTWLASEDLIRRFVAGVDAIAEGRLPVRQVPASMRPQGRFELVRSGEGEAAAPSAYARYDTLTEVVNGLDSASLVRAYHELQPLLEEAHRDLGNPNPSFDASIRAAIFELLAAPTVVGDPLLEPRTLGFGYVDPALEGLSAAQKQLLRFGPVNAQRIQRKLRVLALGLGIPESELPDTPRYRAPPRG